ncbi:hypothetical protein GB937_007229 [Aspergillus fischeri]|nr:hypothetical protein GB937_007229 [Aspergillus fischeri]
MDKAHFVPALYFPSNGENPGTLRIEHGLGHRRSRIPNQDRTFEPTRHAVQEECPSPLVSNMGRLGISGSSQRLPSSSEPTENGDRKPHGQVENGRKWP